MLTSCGLGSEKSVNLEEVLSIKLPLKYPLLIFPIAHYKSLDGAINDLSAWYRLHLTGLYQKKKKSPDGAINDLSGPV